MFSLVLMWRPMPFTISPRFFLTGVSISLHPHSIRNHMIHSENVEKFNNNHNNNGTLTALTSSYFWHPDCPFIRIWVVYSVCAIRYALLTIPFEYNKHLNQDDVREEFSILSAALGFSCPLFSVGHTHTHTHNSSTCYHYTVKDCFFRKVKEHLLLLIIFSEVHILLKSKQVVKRTLSSGFSSIHQIFHASLTVKSIVRNHQFSSTCICDEVKRTSHNHDDIIFGLSVCIPVHIGHGDDHSDDSTAHRQ